MELLWNWGHTVYLIKLLYLTDFLSGLPLSAYQNGTHQPPKNCLYRQNLVFILFLSLGKTT